MKSYKIVIIEDEELIREELKTLLVNAGYVVDCVINFAKTIDYIKSAFPDLILLDINLPEQDGYRLCSSIRSFSTTPILFITGRNTTMDELQALTLGGDDYITKPYNIPILLARINLLLRRGTSEQISIMEHNGIQFNLIAGTLTANGKEIELTKTELKIMYYLFKHSLLSVITETPLDSRDLQNIVQMCDGLSMLKRNIGKTASDGSGVTALIDNVDYLSGKWVDKESLTQLYAMAICLFYLSLVFEITGAAILATQILSDREKKRRQDCILQQLGMNRRDIEKLNNRQLSMMFLLPLLPALIISSCFVYVSAGKMQLSAFHLPVFSNNLWIIGSLSIAFVFFILLYGVYYIAARISYRRQ